jgi:hypothetical protein
VSARSCDTKVGAFFFDVFLCYIAIFVVTKHVETVVTGASDRGKGCECGVGMIGAPENVKAESNSGMIVSWEWGCHV